MYIAAVAAAAVLTCGGDGWGGAVSPRNGGPLPQWLLEGKRSRTGAFTIKRGWTQKRRLPVEGTGSDRIAGTGSRYPSSGFGGALSGRLLLPVIPCLYGDTPEPPIDLQRLQDELFTGPWRTGTVHDYFHEVSRGLLDVDGTVYGWVPLANPEVYYTGYIGGDRVGELIREALDGIDGEVDFTVYDNDGPDDIPNSGDDDGFVDVLVLTHPTVGAECRGNWLHLFSHSAAYSDWPASGGAPYETDDPSASGSVIRIDDYIIIPALSCESGETPRMIEIGVLCHELGHAIGLPDLYDYDFGSFGIGDWGLMGTGEWNTPQSPAHPCAWSKEQLGWVTPVEVDWREQELVLDPVELGGDVVKLVLPTARLRRRTRDSYGGTYALVCGYTEAEANTREWPGGAGYGNGWNESVVHDFHYDGTGPCTMVYGVDVDVQEGDDFGMILLETGGTVDTIALYTGTGERVDTVLLDEYLPAGPCDFRLRLLFVSGYAGSDEDGSYDSRAGYSFSIDDVSINGGGLGYSTGFEADAGGWRSDSPAVEYFLVENRRRTGFDKHLHGEGLLVWHCENSIAYSGMANSGGYSEGQARGVVLEEADGRYDLLRSSYYGGNTGDAGDPFPGSTGNAAFGPATHPSSRSNGGAATPAVIGDIIHKVVTSSAAFRAGMPSPLVVSIDPDTIVKSDGGGVTIDIAGRSFLYGTVCHVSRGQTTVPSSGLSWLGEERIVASFPAGRLFAGSWDLTVTSGDGQRCTAGSSIEVVSVFAGGTVETGRNFLRVGWVVRDPLTVRGCLVFRAPAGGVYERITGDTLRSPTGDFSWEDDEVEPETDYAYRIAACLRDGGTETLALSGPYSIRRYSFIADQNTPNPFSTETAVSFFVPSLRTVSVDVYDVAGRHVARLTEAPYERGTHTVVWQPDLEKVTSGVYFCVFRYLQRTKVVKMVLIR